MEDSQLPLEERWSFLIVTQLEGDKCFLNQTITAGNISHTCGEEQQRGFLVQKKFTLKTNEEGQSTIEFILTFAFAIGLSFLFVAHALNMTTGFMTHYATFMSGRTFLSYDATSAEPVSNYNSAQRVATKVFNIYKLDRFGVNSSTLRFNKPAPASSKSVLFSGVSAKFEKRLTPYKLVGGSKKATMMSEGFLGKEPLKIQCWEMTCRAMGLQPGACGGAASPKDITVYDNGC